MVDISVISAYRFHMFRQAQELQRRQSLHELITAMPRWRVSELPPHRVKSRPGLALTRHALRRAPVSDRYLNRAVIADFDSWAARFAGDSVAISALSSFATACIRQSKARGVRVACDRGSWHILEQRDRLNEEHDRWGIPSPTFDPWIVDRELEEYEIADIIVVPSARAAASYVTRGTPPEKIRVVPYGATIARFSTAGVPDKGAFKVISVGRVGFRKGHQYILSAARFLGLKPNELVFVGPVDRDFRRRMGKELIAVTAIGAVSRSEVSEYLQQASVFVLASVEEGLALSLLEAMAHGLPVVATEETGAHEFVDHGKEGFIVPSRDPAALAAALNDLRENPARAIHMGAEGAKRVQRHGTWRAYGDRIHHVLTELINGGETENVKR